MGKIIRISLTEFKKWIFDEKQIIVIMAIIFMHVMVVRPFLDSASKMNTVIGAAEPFIVISNSKTFLLVLPLLFLVMISDFPKMDGNVLFLLQRTGRIKWIIGQLFFLITAVVYYIGIIIFYTLIIGFIYGYLGNGWSLVVTEFRNYYGGDAMPYISAELYWQMSPYEAFLKGAVLLFCYFLLTGTILLVFFVLDYKKIGFLILIAILAIGTACAAINSPAMWFFPTAHAIMEKHFDGIRRNVWMEIRYSVFYYIVTECFAVSISIKRMKSKKIQSVLED